MSFVHVRLVLMKRDKSSTGDRTAGEKNMVFSANHIGGCCSDVRSVRPVEICNGVQGIRSVSNRAEIIIFDKT